MSSAQKIALVAVIQIAVLLSILGFGQWTVWTADTLQLTVTSTSDPQQLGQRHGLLEYGISTLDLGSVEFDLPEGAVAPRDGFTGDVYVELQQGAGDAWSAIAVHGGRDRSAGGTVLIKGWMTVFGRPSPASQAHVMYDAIDAVYAPDSALARMPSGSGHDIRVVLRVNRFGHATPLRFVVDGQPYPLKRR